MKIVGQEQIADMFGVTAKTIVDWQEQGFPIRVRGRPGVPSEYDSQACIEWYMRRELAKIQAESPRDRLARLQADEVELKLWERRGQLVPADQIEPMWMALVTAARSYLRAEPDRLVHLLEHAETTDAKRDLLAETFDEFLRKLSKFNPEADDADDSDESDERIAGAGDAEAVASQGREEAGSAAEDVGGEMG